MVIEVGRLRVRRVRVNGVGDLAIDTGQLRVAHARRMELGLGVGLEFEA